LDIGRMDDGVEQQTQRVCENMAILALDLLARIIAMRIDAGPPCPSRGKPANYCDAWRRLFCQSKSRNH
jgi:hypothetical protein